MKLPKHILESALNTIYYIQYKGDYKTKGENISSRDLQKIFPKRNAFAVLQIISLLFHPGEAGGGGERKS